jgi:hypothetical protein
VYFALWAATKQATRYLIPILPLLAIASAQGLWLLLLQPRVSGGSPSRRHPPGWVAIGVLIAVQAAMLWEGRKTAPQALDAARSIFVEHRTGPDDAMNETERFIATELPAGARLLLLNTNQGFFIRRDYVSDSFFEASQINDLLWRDPSVNGIGRTFARLRVTHILWFAHDWRIAYPSALRAFLEDPGRARLLHRSTDGRFRLYELR